MASRTAQGAWAIAAAATVAGLLLLSGPPGRRNAGDAQRQRPVRLEVRAGQDAAFPGPETRRVRADQRSPSAIHVVTPEFRRSVARFDAVFRPTAARFGRRGAGFAVDVPPGALADSSVPAAPSGAEEVVSFESTNFVDNMDVTGSADIPADPQGAAGPDHVASVTNTTFAIQTKTGTPVMRTALRTFFGPLGPLTLTFDPRVIYDEHAGRWLLITAEFTDTAAGDTVDTGRIFLAVSDGVDPTGPWTLTEIDTVTTFFNPTVGDTVPHWADYPQLAVDEEAIYISAAMFSFFSTGGRFGGVRLWIIDKGAGSGGFYDGETATVSRYDPLPPPALVAGAAPAIVHGTPGATSFGTYLISYSGISDGEVEAVQTVRIDDPLGTPTFTPQLVILGDIHDTSVGLPLAPQLGTSTGLQANDARALSAVWRDDSLWVAFTVTPNAGDPEFGQSVAYWVRLLDAPVPVLAEQGRVSGDDIAPGTHTFFPALSVNADLDVLIGFAASAPTIYPGAYYALHDADDPPGTVGASRTLRAGVDYYVRRLTGPLNRWGDFSSVALDPTDDCFWIFNNYAFPRGTLIDGGTGNGLEDGRWGTRFAKFCNAECAGFPAEVERVVADVAPDTEIHWGDLGPGFRYDVIVGNLSSVREGGGVGPAGCLGPSLDTTSAVDLLPDPLEGDARYFLVRGRSSCAIGNYGRGSDGATRVPTPGCPD